ncbi:hypothetical protein AS026_21075 [Rhizobium altiplani]|uniref:Uncharacterized protein n=1 Tax=Rhizobium altiplani TaxID=1864509 RepID=A0A109J4D9_9HYPH|nr:hypothetical protein [Rhizobium altiplani]KWV42105.1 hypothetical protein AS026_21075 [Rhizobium altiplani]
MQHFKIKAMCIPAEEVVANRRRDIFWLKIIIAVLVYWNLQAVWAVLCAAERASELASRI